MHDVGMGTLLQTDDIRFLLLYQCCCGCQVAIVLIAASEEIDVPGYQRQGLGALSYPTEGVGQVVPEPDQTAKEEDEENVTPMLLFPECPCTECIDDEQR